MFRNRDSPTIRAPRLAADQAKAVEDLWWIKVGLQCYPNFLCHCASRLHMAPSPPRSRDWTFTIFLPPDWVYEHDENKTRYCIFQEEIAPDTGRHHYQGYIQFKRAKRLSEVKNILGR